MFANVTRSERYTRSLSFISEYITDLEILDRYFSINKVPTIIRSPLRQDRNPSFKFFTKDGYKIYYKDFSNGDSGSIYTLLSKLWSTDYKGVAERLYNDFSLGIYEKVEVSKSKPIPKPSKAKIEITTRAWEEHDIDFWSQYGITLKWLNYAEVFPITHFHFIKEEGRLLMGGAKYSYAFKECKEGNTTYKIYQPKAQKGKWYSSHDSSVISLWTKIPESGDKLVICSSLKDALCLSANTLIPAIAPQGEGFMLSQRVIRELKDRYENIYILFDNDQAGCEYGKKLSEITGFTYIEIPKEYQAKDVSDLYKAIWDKDKFKTIITNIINGKNS